MEKLNKFEGFKSEDEIMKFQQNSKEFYRKLNFMKSKNIPASECNAKRCVKCGCCCWESPCDLTEEDMVNISKHLGYMSVADFFKDKLNIQQHDENIFVIIPIRKQEKAGILKPFLQCFTFDNPCIFLDMLKRCRIHSIKPKCGKDHYCYEDNHAGVFYTEEKIVEILNRHNITLEE